MKFKFSFLVLIFATLGFAQTNNNLTAELQALHPINCFSNNSIKEYTARDISNGIKPAIFETRIDGNSASSMEVEVFSIAKSHYDIGASWKMNKNIKKGDVVLARVSFRALYAKQESGEAVVYFYVQREKSSADKSIIIQLGAGPEEKTYDLPFIALEDMPAGEGQISISFGSLQQKVEVSNIELYNFENKITLDKLPTTRFTYNGRENNAAWRNEALKRIEEIRTAPIEIKIVDSNKKPILGAKVEVKMLQSDFIWGTAVNEAILANDLPDNPKYKKVLQEFYNTIVIENGFKGGSWKIDPKRQEETIKAFEWAEKNGFRQRGHNLVWPAWKFNPKSTKELALKDSVAFEKFIEDEIRDKASFLKDRVIAWDVVNELLHEKDYFPYLPKDIVVKWFQIAKEVDPNAGMFINEYGMLNSISSPKNIKEYLQVIAELRSKGAPIDGIGIQGHVGRQPRDPAQVISDLELFRPMGIPVQITEFDINMKDEELQADYTRDFLIACYSSPVVTGFTMWGFWEPKHWKKDAAMFRNDWSEKPNAAVWRNLVAKQWKTSFTQETDKEGVVKSKGHLGSYEMTITKGNLIKKIKFRLTKDIKPIQLVLD
ncbi:MAG: endo-1,4-beta-xylanase [Flavobacterium sp.]|nr:endo-1,4-beta-xylanase [Flavobacterium sp.]